MDWMVAQFPTGRKLSVGEDGEDMMRGKLASQVYLYLGRKVQDRVKGKLFIFQAALVQV